MIDKKTFGLFIKIKRTEKNYSQKDLAEMLFVTEGAVSKWERGVSYPDITLISDICRVLQISEHELITASTDTHSRKIKHEAKKFRVIRNVWFWVPTISYMATLLICFICNLAVDHTLSW
ncbi:MAG: helix-turn-helix transcriptional regulator, partial [Clostridia bacterium]|nr:helix-turn-helix transcriptional regulator [Clostridia bacterium]